MAHLPRLTVRLKMTMLLLSGLLILSLANFWQVRDRMMKDAEEKAGASTLR